MYIDFATIASEQIVNQAAKIHYMSGGRLKVPIVIRTQQGAGIRNGAQHSQSLEAWYMHIPGLKVVMPSNPHDAKGMLKAAIRDDNPVLFIEHKKLYSIKGELPEEGYIIEPGKASMVKTGKDLTIISNSFMVMVALELADMLEDRYSISCEVIDLRSISPVDIVCIIESIKKTNKVAVLHEAPRQGGIGGEISAMIQEQAFDYLDYPVLRICGPDTPVPFCSDLEDLFIPSAEKCFQKVVDFFQLVR